MKTVLHIDEAKKWPLTLGNAKNMVKYAEEMGIDFDLEIVANDEAVRQLQDDLVKTEGYYADIEELALETVKFTACRNAMNKYDIKENSLIPFVEVVPAGIAELTRKQHEGFAYIKP